MPFFFAAFFIFLSLPLTAPLAAQERTIPLLISDHHADHLEFFFRHGRNTSAAMIVLDAHCDTVANGQYGLIRNLAAAGNFSRAGELAGNHNWIHPLTPAPLGTLAWISTIRGYPRSDKLEGFRRSLASWDRGIFAIFLSVEELRFLEIIEQTLFVSVDLDFFYSENHGPQDVFPVLDALFAFSSRRTGAVVWAFCLSRPWLPDDRYAWTLLEQCLSWLNSRREFRAPEITLFSSSRVDTSRTAEAFRAEGREVPALREADTPERIRALIGELWRRRN